MAKIYRYQKVTDKFTSYTPQGEGLTELCTLPDGYTYFSVADDGKLADEQPEQIQIEEPTITDELKEQIKTASPHYQLIYTRMQQKIRDKYCAEDEMYFTRISVGQLAGMYTMQPGEPEKIAEYQTYIEEIRQWGKTERAHYGL